MNWVKRQHVTDFIASLFSVLLVIFLFYAGTSDEISAAVYFNSVLEVYSAPFYPGLFMIYPPVLALVLCGIMVWGFRVKTRKARLPIFIVSLALWAGLGLFTIVMWYR